MSCECAGCCLLRQGREEPGVWVAQGMVTQQLLRHRAGCFPEGWGVRRDWVPGFWVF